MKKLLLAILGLSVIFVGCGKEITKEKEKEEKPKEEVTISKRDKNELIEMLEDLDEDDFVDMMEDAEYTEIKNEVFKYYVSADFIKSNSIEIYEYDFEAGYLEKGEIYFFIHYDEESDFLAQKTVGEKDGHVQYQVTVTTEAVKLSILLTDQDNEYVAAAYYKYKKGKFELSYSDETDESDDLIDGHKEDAIEFFETAFVELDSVLN